MTVSYHQLVRDRVEKDVEARNLSKDTMVIDGKEPQKISFHGFLRNLKCRGARERAKFISNEIELYFEKLMIVSTNVKDF